MNHDETLFERLRRTQNKFIEQKEAEGMKFTIKENWQGDDDHFFEKNGEEYSLSALCKLTLALQLPHNNFNRLVKEID